MSIEDVESGVSTGNPFRLFLFTMGSDRWGYQGQDVVPFTYNGTDFMPDELIDLGQVGQSLADLSTDIDVTISIDTAVAQFYTSFLPPEPLMVRVLRTHPDWAPGEYLVELIGEVVSSSFEQGDGSCTLTVRQLTKDLDRTVPWCVYSTTCNYALYGAGCQVNREEYVTETSIIGGASTNLISAAAFASAAQDHGATDQEVIDSWFRGGFVVHERTREVRFILNHDGTDLLLSIPFSDARNGDVVRAYAGCDHTRRHCRLKFDNLDRMLAFPWMPSKNPYTQSVWGNERSYNAKGGTSGNVPTLQAQER